MIHYLSSSLSDRGRQRRVNNDRLFEDRDLGLFAVADGMGQGSQPSASQVAITALGKHLDHLGATTIAATRDWLQTIFEHASRRIQIDDDCGNDATPSPGTTLSVLRLLSDSYVIGHIGDSRVYRLSGGQMQQLTRDHTHVEELVRGGSLTRTEARYHPERNLVTRHLGGPTCPEVDIHSGPVAVGDLFILVTDGVTEHLDDEALRQIASDGQDLETMVTEIVNRSSEIGGADDMTVIAVRVTASEEGTPTATGDRTGAAPPVERPARASGGDPACRGRKMC